MGNGGIASTASYLMCVYLTVDMLLFVLLCMLSLKGYSLQPVGEMIVL